jgi:hypothetical protein
MPQDKIHRHKTRRPATRTALSSSPHAKEARNLPSIAMSFIPDEYKCWIFGTALLLYYIAQRWFGRRLQVTWLNNLARFYRLYALLCGTRFFTPVLFFYLLAKDVCSTIEDKVVEKLDSSRAFARVLDTPIPNQDPAPVNNQLLSWMDDDAEEVWKQKREARDAKLQQIQDARAAYFRSSTEEYSSLDDVCYDENGMIGASTIGSVATPYSVAREMAWQAVAIRSSLDRWDH